MRSQLTASLALSGSFQHVDARFRAGANAGKEVVLTPRNTASARLNWNHGPQSARAGVQWVVSQRYGNDFANTCAARMPSYVTVDALYALRLAKWELALSGTNLGNRNYFSQASVAKAVFIRQPGGNWISRYVMTFKFCLSR